MVVALEQLLAPAASGYVHNLETRSVRQHSRHPALMQKDEVFNEATDDSFRNAVAVMPLFARSVAAELREASDQVGEPHRLLSALHAAQHAMQLVPQQIKACTPLELL